MTASFPSPVETAATETTKILRTVVVDGVRWVYTRRDGWQVPE